ncbi:MAG: GIY-YIG nuclease family protein [Alphaproteobacteria bacterium]|nr:MAG: GIY-YIG nuclease family protein [Alphaproteobacteria bacterium]
MSFQVYIMASRRNGTLYTGHTDNLVARAWQHRTGAIRGFASRYGCTRLVWFETHDTRASAFERERRIKEWKRAWKLELIEAANPQWRDLYDELVGWTPVPLHPDLARPAAHPGESRGPGPRRAERAHSGSRLAPG